MGVSSGFRVLRDVLNGRLEEVVDALGAQSAATIIPQSHLQFELKAPFLQLPVHRIN